MNYHCFTASTLPLLCDKLVQNDPDLGSVIKNYGYPPFWDRPNTFETLVHIILEQQVSLASARATLEKLQQRIGTITPENITALPDDEFKGAYVSRQKKTYLKGLAMAVLENKLTLNELPNLPDDEVRTVLTSLKGIGNWTADIYLIMVLHRTDIFPLGDIAAITALKELKNVPKIMPTDELVPLINAWQPNRTIGAMLLWHNYLSIRHRSY